MAVAATAKWVISWADLSGVTYALNVNHAQIAAGNNVTQALTDQLGADLQAAFEAPGSWQDIVSDQVQLRAVILQDIRTDGNPEFEAIIGSIGANATHAVPDVASMVYTKQTGGGTPNGRIFLWGASEGGNANNGRPTAAAIAAGQEFCDQMLAMFPVTSGPDSLLDFSIVGKNVLGDPTRFTVQSFSRSGSASLRGWQTQRGRRTAVREQ